jgi:hypothetical protein
MTLRMDLANILLADRDITYQRARRHDFLDYFILGLLDPARGTGNSQYA